MKKILTTLALILLATPSYGLIKVAIIDVGFDSKRAPEVPLCKSGHAYVQNTVKTMNTPPQDSKYSDFHGTNVASIIAQSVGSAYKKEYCVIIIKYDEANASGKTSAMAIRHAISQGVDFINYSGGGYIKDADEDLAVKEAFGAGITFVAAAGNRGLELGKSASYYPAMSHSYVTVVGSTKSGERRTDSNYGDIVDVWEEGTNVYGGGVSLSGTSQATAKVTGKFLRIMIQTRMGEMKNESSGCDCGN